MTKPLSPYRPCKPSSSLAWSPDGQRLAFVAARDGDNADLYLYDLNSAAVSRLSNENEQAADLHWSPDGQFIEYVAVNSFGTGAGFDMAALWVYDIQAQQPRLLENLDSGGEEFIGWKDAGTFYMHSWDRLCESTNLRSVNVISAEQETISHGCFTGIDYSPELKEGLLSVTDFNHENCTCGSPLDAGTYIFGQGLNLKKFQKVSAYSIGYVPEIQAFTIFGDGGLEYIYNGGGASLEIPPEVKGLKPYPSPSSDTWVWASYYSGKTGLWVTSDYMEPIEISPLYTGAPYWSEDGPNILLY